MIPNIFIAPEKLALHPGAKLLLVGFGATTLANRGLCAITPTKLPKPGTNRVLPSGGDKAGMSKTGREGRELQVLLLQVNLIVQEHSKYQIPHQVFAK